MSLRQQKKQETHALLLNVASKLFNRLDYELVTIDSLSEAAGISRKTFFNYFPSKACLLEALVIEWIENSSLWASENATLVDAESALIPPNMDKISAWLMQNRRLLKMVERYTQLFQSSIDPQGHYQARVYAKSGKPRLKRILQAQALGFVRDDIEALLICQMYDTLRLDAVRHWLLQADEQATAKSFQKHYEGLRSVILKGIAL